MGMRPPHPGMGPMVPSEIPLPSPQGYHMDQPWMGGPPPGMLPAQGAEAPQSESFLKRGFKGAGSAVASGWQSFADTMDGIFVPEGDGAPAPPAHPAMQACGSAHLADAAAAGGCGPPWGPPAWHMQGPLSAPDNVPAMFREPCAQEVQDLLEVDGLPAYVALGGGRGFTAKRLCLDGGGRSIYILEPDAKVPSIFLGVPGFSLSDLQRVVYGAPGGAPEPMVSLEFNEGYLPVRLGDAAVLRGFLNVLQSCRQGLVVVPQGQA